jgi:hypothetical protein
MRPLLQDRCCTLSGGSWSAVSTGSGATVTLNGGQVVGNAADITLSGTGSLIQARHPANTSVLVALEDSLMAITEAGTLRILDGRAFNAANALTNSGDVVVDGAGSAINTNGDYVQAAGTTRVNGSLSSATGLVDIQAGLLAGTGTIDANVSSLGQVAPGDDGTGTLTISGDYLQDSTATLSIEIGGPTFGNDLLSVDGDATLGGTLDVSLFGGFEPTLGQSFDILLADAILGDFDGFNLPVFSGLTFDVLVESTFVQLQTRVVPIPAAIWLFASALLALFGMARRKAI